MLSFDIGPLRVEGPAEHWAQALLAVGGPFEIRFDGRVWYAEPDFPVPGATTEDVLGAIGALTAAVRDALPEAETELRSLAASPANARLVAALR